MPVIRINALGDRPVLHDSPAPVWPALQRAAAGPGPVVAMLHGYRYEPGHARHCPHRHLLAAGRGADAPGWPGALGFGTGQRREGLAIAFGWPARGALRQAQGRAVAAGRALALVLDWLHRQRPDRPCHIIAHSLGIAPALAALPFLRPGAVGRIIALTGAAYQSRAAFALSSAAGRAAEFLNITSRENDPFDFLFERLIPAPCPGDRAIGLGLDGPNAVTLQLDCPGTLAHLARLGKPVAAPSRRVCHWSAYTRPGTMEFYRDLLRHSDLWPLARLRSGLPGTPSPRWSRLLAPFPSAIRQETRSSVLADLFARNARRA